MLTLPAVGLRPQMLTDTDNINGLPLCVTLFLLPVIALTDQTASTVNPLPTFFCASYDISNQDDNSTPFLSTHFYTFMKL